MSIVLDGTTGVTAPALTGPIDAANLTGALPAIDGSALTGLSSGGMTLLGTLATTSGTSVTLSGLDLTGYKQLSIVCNAVSGSNGTTDYVRINGKNIFLIGFNNDSFVGHGGATIDLSSGVFWSVSKYTDATYGNAFGNASGLTTASTSITFTVSAGTFDAGSIIVYGVA
jgi:hypothetical protein